MASSKIVWKKVPDEHDYPAAQDYLELLYEPQGAARIVQALQSAPTTYKKAKDVLRASGLDLLPGDNVHVAKDVKKV